VQDPCYSSCRLVCSDAIITTDAQGLLNSFNQPAQDLFGYLPSEVIGRPFENLLKGGKAEAQRIRESLIKRDIVQMFEVEIVAKNRHFVPVHLSSSRLKNVAGDTVGFIAICHDLSPIRSLETAIEQRDRFFASILKNSADAIMTMDPEERVTSWNKGAEAIFGYTEEEMLGESLEILIPEDLRQEKELEKISHIARMEGYLRSYQTRRVTKDGQTIDVIFTRTAIRDNLDNLVGYSSVLKDVTEQRLIERHLAQMEKLSAIGELSAGLAHEIKNPLAGIKGAIEIIRDGLAEENPHRSILAEVLAEVSRIDRIVMSLLSYAKPKKPDFVRVDITRLLRDVVSFLENLADGKGIRFRLHFPPDLPWLTADENDFKQLFMNLILNSIEALQDGGEVVVSAELLPDAKLRMVISDNGPGIAPEYLERVFRPFFTTKAQGTGLGLATCKRIVSDYGGEIHAVSNPGAGTSFLIELPISTLAALPLTMRP
jgi:two-component system, sporulation sensor kinase A